MRLDKFLKKSGIIKRRSLAQEMIGKGLVLLNGREPKPSSQVKVGDRIEVYFPYRIILFKVIDIEGRNCVKVLKELRR